MSKKITALFLVAAMTVCMAMPVFAGVTDWNTPTTTDSEGMKTSECEVTADIHYAYYVSMPATLALEPGTAVNEYVCDYQVKAKADATVLADKNIKIAPPELQGTAPDQYNLELHDSTFTHTAKGLISQAKVLFGTTPSGTVEKVDNTKWAAIDGTVKVTIADQGTYTGNFDFTYGLTDK